MDKKIAFENLKEAVKVLNELKVKYWLEAGTCLGAWREKDFISFDMDLDLGIMAKDLSTKQDYGDFVHGMLMAGFTIHHVFGELDCGFEVAFKRKGIKLDVFWFYEKGDKLWHAAWLNGGRNGMKDIIKLVFDKKLFENLGLVHFKGEMFNVPAPTEEYLIARYGPEWFIPNKNWAWDKDPKCIDPDFDIA